MKKLTALGLGLASALALVFPVFAEESGSVGSLCPENSTFSALCKFSEPGPVLGIIVNFIFIVAIILAFGFLIYGGIRWITSGGDKGGVENARNTIIAAIVGLIVVFLAYVILNLVLGLFGTNLTNLTFPTINQAGGGRPVDKGSADTCGIVGKRPCDRQELQDRIWGNQKGAQDGCRGNIKSQGGKCVPA